MIDRDFDRFLSFSAKEMKVSLSRLYICIHCNEMYSIMGLKRRKPPIKADPESIGYWSGPMVLDRASCEERDIPYDKDYPFHLFDGECDRPTHKLWLVGLCARPEGHDWLLIKDDGLS